MTWRSWQQVGELEVISNLFSSLGPALLISQLDVLQTLGHRGVRVVQGGVIAGCTAGTGRWQSPG